MLPKIFEETEFRIGVLSVVAASEREIGDYFIDHAIPKLISFTGSTEAGQTIGKRAVSGTLSNVQLQSQMSMHHLSYLMMRIQIWLWNSPLWDVFAPRPDLYEHQSNYC